MSEQLIQKAMDNTVQVPWSGCMIWMGSVNKNGYAQGSPEGKTVRIHRWLYIKLHGDVGELVIDHLCSVRCCINPYHLEAVTSGINSTRGKGPAGMNKRKTKCKNGHEFDRLVTRKSGLIVRRCSICKAAKDALRDRRNIILEMKRANRKQH